MADPDFEEADFDDPAVEEPDDFEVPDFEVEDFFVVGIIIIPPCVLEQVIRQIFEPRLVVQTTYHLKCSPYGNFADRSRVEFMRLNLEIA